MTPTEIQVGDTVAIAVLTYRRARLQVGTVVKVDGDLLSIRYDSPWGGPMQTVKRYDCDAVKVAA